MSRRLLPVLSALLPLKWQPELPARRALCAAAAIVVLFGAAGIALDVAWVPRWSSIDASSTPAQAELADHPVQRCSHCGWIESKREIVSSVAAPLSLGVYEYTVRMNDGSSSVFRETLPSSWRLGERLTVIDGTSMPLH